MSSISVPSNSLPMDDTSAAPHKLAVRGPRRRIKRFSAKVRSGCHTCKIRRIKCDEAKPSCQKCTSTGRKCDGYPASASASKPIDLTAVASFPPYSSSSSLLAFTAPSPSLTPLSHCAGAGVCGTTSQERHALYMFRTKIGRLLSCAFDIEFWTCDLLHAADESIAIRHAVAAVAAAYKDSVLLQQQQQQPVNATDTRTRNSSLATLQPFILDQYNKSIKLLHGCLDGLAAYSLKQKVTILIINLLFYCLCAIRGLRKEACLHLRSGLALLHEWQIGQARHASSALPGDQVQEKTPTHVKLLVAAYTRLDTQARIIISASRKSSPPPPSPTTTTTPLASSSSVSPLPCCGKLQWHPHNATIDGWGSGYLGAVRRAFGQLETLSNRIVQFVTSSADSPSLSLSPLPSTLDTNTNTIYKWRRQLTAWEAEYSSLLTEQTPNARCVAMKALRVRYLLASAWLDLVQLTTLSSSMTDDHLRLRCASILDFVIDILHADNYQPHTLAFNPQGSLVEALYFVARHCPHLSLRQHAVLLMRTYPIVEGLWESSAAADSACAACPLPLDVTLEHGRIQV